MIVLEQYEMYHMILQDVKNHLDVMHIVLVIEINKINIDYYHEIHFQVIWNKFTIHTGNIYVNEKIHLIMINQKIIVIY